MSLIYLSIKLIVLGLKNLFFRKDIRKCGEERGIKVCAVAQMKAPDNLEPILERRGDELETGKGLCFKKEEEGSKFHEKKEKGGGIKKCETAQMKIHQKLEGKDDIKGLVGRGKKTLFDDEEDLSMGLGFETKNPLQIDFERDPDCLDFEPLERMQKLVDEFVIRNKHCVQMKTSYERDEKMFENALFASTGEKVLVIVGMMHLDGWRYMVEQLNKREEEGRKEEGQMGVIYLVILKG